MLLALRSRPRPSWRPRRVRMPLLCPPRRGPAADPTESRLIIRIFSPRRKRILGRSHPLEGRPLLFSTRDPHSQKFNLERQTGRRGFGHFWFPAAGVSPTHRAACRMALSGVIAPEAFRAERSKFGSDWPPRSASVRAVREAGRAGERKTKRTCEARCVQDAGRSFPQSVTGLSAGWGSWLGQLAGAARSSGRALRLYGYIRMIMRGNDGVRRP